MKRVFSTRGCEKARRQTKMKKAHLNPGLSLNINTNKNEDTNQNANTNTNQPPTHQQNRPGLDQAISALIGCLSDDLTHKHQEADIEKPDPNQLANEIRQRLNERFIREFTPKTKKNK